MEEPVPFIETTSEGKLSVNIGALQYLEQSKDSVAVIAIAGKYRTGKSYLLNRFFNSNRGFSLGANVQGKTKGIWLWARPHPLDPRIRLILLDTEGLYDVDRSDQYDINLFTLAVLLSDCLIYNAVGTLDETLFKELHLVTELADHVHTKATPSRGESDQQLNKYLPRLFIVLRNFFLQLSLNDQPCTADDYLENALQYKPGQSRSVQTHNSIRECIRTNFPARKCFTLCKPIADDRKLQELDKVMDSDLKPEFLESSSACVRDVLSKAQPFCFDGVPMNGPRFLKMTDFYVQAINDGAVPCIPSMFENLKRQECEQTLHLACDEFVNFMSCVCETLPVEESVIYSAEKEAFSMALTHFESCAPFDEDGTYHGRLLNTLESCHQDLLERNHQESTSLCKNAIQECFQHLGPERYFGRDGLKAFKEDEKEALVAYSEIPNKGPAAQTVLDEFVRNTVIEMQKSIATSNMLLHAMEEDICSEDSRRSQQEESAAASRREQARLTRVLRRTEVQHQERMAASGQMYAASLQQSSARHKRDLNTWADEWKRRFEQDQARQAQRNREVLEEEKRRKGQVQEELRRNKESLKKLKRETEDLQSKLHRRN